MLLKLKVKNIVLISAAEIDFSAGFNVLTGETGAGKSILIDSLLLLLGGRFDKNLLKYGEDAASVEGLFSLNEKAKKQLEEFGLEVDDHAVITRKFFEGGKSETRINGQIITAVMLKNLTANLMDIYGQRDYALLESQAEQLRIFDYYARHKQRGLLEKLSEKCTFYAKIKKELLEIGSLNERAKTIDFLAFQIKEIEESAVKDGEEDELCDERKRILNAARITEALDKTDKALSSNAAALAARHLESVAEFGGEFDVLAQRLKTVAIELDDIVESVYSLNSKSDYDEGRLDDIEERLSLIRQIKRKYGDVAAMRKFLSEAKERLVYLENCDELFERKSAEFNKLKQQIYEFSVELSLSRKETAPVFAGKINEQLAELGMQNAEFKIDFAPLPSLNDCESAISPLGMDKIEFSISTNPGQPFGAVMKILSGGEMSRFMLALKIVSGDSDGIPTLIFDEIDNGISGKIGQEVAKKLARLAKIHQILCVTHLPQIAAMASAHFNIIKLVENGETATVVTPLDRAGMIEEISRLSGGINISGKSLENAAEMKSWSDEYKGRLAE